MGQTALAQDDPRDPDPGFSRHAPRRILVRLRTADDEPSPFVVGGDDEDWRQPPEPNSARAIAESMIEAVTGGRLLHRLWFVPGLQVWEVDRGAEAERAVAAADVPWVVYAQVDHVGHLARAPYPNDPAYVAGYQWGLERVCIEAAWNVVTETDQYPIAIVDSGVDYLNAQLGPNIKVNTLEPLPPDGIDNDGNGYIDDHWGANVTVHGLTCAEAIACDQTCEGDPMDIRLHGKHVAAVAGAVTDDCRSIAGAAGKCSLIAVKVHSDQENPCIPFGITDASIVLGFEYAAQRGARIANCSWTSVASSVLYEAFKGLHEYNIVAVLCAGNHCCNIDASTPACEGSYPARYTFANMIVVGASNKSDAPWAVPPPHGPLECGSNYGAASVDLFAPGENIRSLSAGDSTTSCVATPSGHYEIGTSFAAPLVSGIAALVWAANPGFSAVDVVNRLKSTARAAPSLSGLCVTGGVVDASAALGVGPCAP